MMAKGISLVKNVRVFAVRDRRRCGICGRFEPVVGWEPVGPVVACPACEAGVNAALIAQARAEARAGS